MQNKREIKKEKNMMMRFRGNLRNVSRAQNYDELWSKDRKFIQIKMECWESTVGEGFDRITQNK